jgi:hypothetical protein
LRAAPVRSAGSDVSPSSRRRVVAVTVAWALGALILAGCGGGSPAGFARAASGGAGSGSGTSIAPSRVRIAITPSAGTDRRPERGLTVTATGGTLTKVRASVGGKAVEGTMNRADTVWHSRWALGVSEDYSVTASATRLSRAL